MRGRGWPRAGCMLVTGGMLVGHVRDVGWPRAGCWLATGEISSWAAARRDAEEVGGKLDCYGGVAAARRDASPYLLGGARGRFIEAALLGGQFDLFAICEYNTRHD